MHSWFFGTILAVVFLQEALVLKQVVGLCCAVAAIILLAG
jgi:uncharacterized membrane protein